MNDVRFFQRRGMTMKRHINRARCLLALFSVAVLTACGGGGGGGGGGGEANPGFSQTPLQPVAGSSFSAGVAINDGNEAVGLSDDATAVVKAAAWTITTTGATTTSTVTRLQTPNGTYGAAYGNNDGGAIVGEMEQAGGSIVAAFWSGKAAVAVSLDTPAPATGSAAYGINTSGRIVGELLVAGVPTAVTWATSGAVPAALPTALGTIASSAYFINDNGEIVGELTNAAGTHAALWKPTAGAYGSTPVLLPSPNGDSLALSINTAGNIVGEAAGTDGKPHATRWVLGTGGSYTLQDLGPADVASSAAGINDAGRVVGHVNDAADAVSTASAWRATPPATPFTVDAALLYSQAYAINTTGRTVGFADGQAFVGVPR
jgi:hypothetical protein